MHPLRPPGALVEREFLAACIRCGQCVEACPFDTLRLMDLNAGLKAGSPTFDAATNPCWLCQGYDSLKCIDACPTNALERIDDPREVRIGLAVINEDTCLAYNGAMCRACWHACPYPNEAIVYDSMLRPTVDAAVCTGCGLCVHGCPVEPKAIVIESFGKRRRGFGKASP
jgi:ferredoxin-type protein NapG